MISTMTSVLRAGVVSLVALATATSAVAAPLAVGLDLAAPGNGAIRAIPVEMGEGRDFGPGYRIWPRYNRHWNRGWRNGGNWNGGHWRRGGWGRGWGAGGLALGLGIGIPLGYYAGRYDGYYDDPYYYDEPVYRPRVYRQPRYAKPRYYAQPRYVPRNGGLSNDHNHCDNTYLTGPKFFRC